MRIEIRTLDQHIGSLRRDFRLFAAHNSSQRHRLLGVGNDQHVAGKSSLNTVESLQLLSRCSTTNNDATTAEFFEVESVQRLAEFVQNVVGDVGNIIDGPLTDCFETPGQPLRRWANLDASHESRGITRTEIGIFDLDGSQARRSPFSLRLFTSRQTQVTILDHTD